MMTCITSVPPVLAGPRPRLKPPDCFLTKFVKDALVSKPKPYKESC